MGVIRFVTKFVTDIYMGPDGETWAMGRVYTIPMMALGISYPIYLAWKGQPPSLADLAVELGGLGAAVGGMVAVTNHIDNPSQAKGGLV